MSRPSTRSRAVFGQEFLYGIIDVIGSGPDLSTILQRFVPLVMAATECHGCFVYFVEDSSLVLRTASAGYTHLEGRVRLGMDEGLTGWVARNRRSAFIKDKALEDPRMAVVPEIEEEQYQSLVSVPILSRGGDVIGVITLHARAPHEFRPQDLEFLEHAASLIAGAIENARLYEEAVGRVEQLTQLSVLAQDLAAAATTGVLLTTVTRGCRILLAASACELYLVGPDGRLEAASTDPPREGAPDLDARQVWPQLVAAEASPAAASAVARLIWATPRDGVPIFSALTMGDERVGLLCALVERAGQDRRSMLASVAASTAVAIRRRQLIESLEEKNLVKDFFEALASPQTDGAMLRRQAARLHSDVDAAHLVLHAVPWAAPKKQRPAARAADDDADDWTRLAAQVEARLRVELPRSIFDQHESLLHGLVRVPPEGASSAVDTVRRVYQSAAGDKGPIVIGLSNPCVGPAAILHGLEEARSAAEVGTLLRGRPGVFAYEDLGAYRYVVSAEDSVRDRYQDGLQRLVDYRQGRGADLLRTLEAYIEHQGSIARTARALYMHPNTLRQRLARIERLASFELEKEDWLSLGMAIKLVKLRLIRGATSTPLPVR